MKDLPWLLKNNNFQYFESLAKRQGMWIPEQSGSRQAAQVAEQKEQDQPNRSKMSGYQEIIEFSKLVKQTAATNQTHHNDDSDENEPLLVFMPQV